MQRSPLDCFVLQMSQHLVPTVLWVPVGHAEPQCLLLLLGVPGWDWRVLGVGSGPGHSLSPYAPSLLGHCDGCTTRSGLAAEPSDTEAKVEGQGTMLGPPMWIGTDLLGGWFMAELWVHPGAEGSP